MTVSANGMSCDYARKAEAFRMVAFVSASEIPGGSHVAMLCRNHPDLRWSCKAIAVSGNRYNGSRNIFFFGAFTGNSWEKPVAECECKGSDLRTVESFTNQLPF